MPLAPLITICLCCHRPVRGFAFCIRCAKAGCTPTICLCGGGK